MANIILNVSFKLNDENLLDDWKKMSADITKGLEKVDGFIARESARGEDGTVYCILQWESLTQQENFRKNFESNPDFAEMMAEFAQIVNMETMQEDVLTVL